MLSMANANIRNQNAHAMHCPTPNQQRLKCNMHIFLLTIGRESPKLRRHRLHRRYPVGIPRHSMPSAQTSAPKLAVQLLDLLQLVVSRDLLGLVVDCASVPRVGLQQPFPVVCGLPVLLGADCHHCADWPLGDLEPLELQEQLILLH
jgi:hypothetical protein